MKKSLPKLLSNVTRILYMPSVSEIFRASSYICIGIPTTTDCNLEEFNYDEAMLHYRYLGLQKIAIEQFNCSLTPMDPLIKMSI